jgi:hypothetical protein
VPKSLLAYRQVGLPYTHNLTKLIEIGAGIDAAFHSLLPTVTPLTPYAVELRYDDSFWLWDRHGLRRHAESEPKAAQMEAQSAFLGGSYLRDRRQSGFSGGRVGLDANHSHFALLQKGQHFQ